MGLFSKKKPAADPAEAACSAEVDPVSGAVLETPELQVLGLELLRKRIAAAALRLPRDDDRFLRAFLRARKYNIAGAYLALSNFSAFWYDPANRDIIDGMTFDESVKAYAALGLVETLSERDVHGNLVSLLYMGKLDWSVFTGSVFKAQVRFSLLHFFAMLDDDTTQLRGMTMVESLRGFSLAAARASSKALDSKEQKKVMALFTDTLPVRLRNIWVLDQPGYFNFFFAVVKVFFKAKIIKRVKLVGTDYAKVHAEVPASILPPLFGGTSEEPRGQYLAALEAQVAATGALGGFAIPASVDNPLPKPKSSGGEGGASSVPAAASTGAAVEEPAAAATPAAEATPAAVEEKAPVEAPAEPAPAAAAESAPPTPAASAFAIDDSEETEGQEEATPAAVEEPAQAVEEAAAEPAQAAEEAAAEAPAAETATTAAEAAVTEAAAEEAVAADAPAVSSEDVVVQA